MGAVIEMHRGKVGDILYTLNRGIGYWPVRLYLYLISEYLQEAAGAKNIYIADSGAIVISV